jgi:serine/threonine protein kinase
VNPPDPRPADPSPQAGPPDDDARLIRAVQDYTVALESGQKPDRAAWLARYSDLGEEFAQCLEGLEILHQAAPRKRSALAAAANAPADLSPATPLGDFQITCEIGRGGMGIVYEAMQLSLGRRVAVKVLPFAATFDSRQLQRFRHEAQAAAQLHHSNIVPVYAVGCERGIHFYAMQLIEGRSLDHLIRCLRESAGLEPYAPGSRLASTQDLQPAPTPPEPVAPQECTTHRGAEATADPVSVHLSNLRTGRQPEYYRRVAGLMAQAAEALEYAHQQGVVHRDIKPGNLLVDARGHLWITDFGLAHFQVDTGLTQTGDVLGTVRYMSPEQASGQRVVLDHRTDVYSLGATFYELLTLNPVFAGASRHSLMVQVVDREPRPPRAIDPSVPSELETILLKALNKAPQDRYASAQDLADDLHRFLRDEPIRARRPSSVERLRKWSRRHPAVIASGVLAMFLVLVVSLVSNWLIKRANDRTSAALAAEQVRSEEAQKHFLQAKQAVDLLIEVAQDELGDKPPLQHLRKRLLESALGYYQDFISQRRQAESARTEGRIDAPSQADLIAVEQRLKKILDELSVLEGAGQWILLSERGIQTDLGLSGSQRQQVEMLGQQFVDRRRELFRDFGRLTIDQRRSRFVDLARANDHSMRKTLTPQQLARLDQINLQLQGPAAFRQAEVAARLELTDAQRQAIRQIEAETMASQWERRHPPGPRPPGGGFEREAAVRAAALAKILALLTPTQRAAWQELTGAPYHRVPEIPRHGPFHGMEPEPPPPS